MRFWSVGPGERTYRSSTLGVSLTFAPSARCLVRASIRCARSALSLRPSTTLTSFASLRMTQRGSLLTHRIAAVPALKQRPLLRSLFLLNLVELSGYCPPSPKSLTGAFSRLSFEFFLFRRTPQSGAYRRPQILCLVRASNHAIVPARIYGRRAERIGRPSASGHYLKVRQRVRIDCWQVLPLRSFKEGSQLRLLTPITDLPVEPNSAP